MTNKIKPISMPKWGMEMSEGEINTWHVKVGDQVNIEDDLVDVETAKIVNTVTAADSGIVRAILAQPGETHNIGGLLGVLASADISEDDIQAFISSYPSNSEAVVIEEAPIMSEVANESVAPAEKQLSNLDLLAGGADDSHVPASPVARRLAKRRATGDAGTWLSSAPPASRSRLLSCFSAGATDSFATSDMIGASSITTASLLLG